MRKQHTIWISGQRVELDEPEHTVMVDGQDVDTDDDDGPEVGRRDDSTTRKRELRRAFAASLRGEPPAPAVEPETRESRRMEAALRHAAERRRRFQ